MCEVSTRSARGARSSIGAVARQELLAYLDCGLLCGPGTSCNESRGILEASQAGLVPADPGFALVALPG